MIKLDSMFSDVEIASISGGRRPPAPRGYKLPTVFPSLNKAKRISLDLESLDESIGEKKGPGWRRDAYIVGFGLGIGDRKGNIEFCVAPETKVLTAKLEWKRADTLSASVYPLGVPRREV